MSVGRGVGMELTVVETDADYEAFRQVRMAVLPYERCATVEELRKARTDTRLMVVARVGGTLVGSGLADRGDTADGFVAPRVLEEHRRQGYGTAILEALVEHLRSVDLWSAKAGADDAGSVAFAARHGFVEVDREVEQVRTIGDEPEPEPVPGLEVVTLAEHPDLWSRAYEPFGREAMSDFALYAPLEVSQEKWELDWAGDPMFLALDQGEVVGCAGLFVDTDVPDRGEHALTAVRRTHRGRGIAVHLKQRTLHWAAGHGLREVYTWTQQGNAPMRALNERLGFRDGITSVTVSKDLT